MMQTPGHIGIVACSAEGAALCYRTICQEAAALMGGHAHPEISLHSQSLAHYVECLDRNDWQGVADLMLASASKLAASGAEFLICPDNTIHQAMDLVMPRSSLPFRTAPDRMLRTMIKSPSYPSCSALPGTLMLKPDPFATRVTFSPLATKGALATLCVVSVRPGPIADVTRNPMASLMDFIA